MRATRHVGHRFLAPNRFAVRDFADYQAKLRAAKVILDPDERRRLIAAEAHGWRRPKGSSSATIRRCSTRSPGWSNGRGPSRPHRRGVHGRAAGGADHRDAHAPEIFRAADGGGRRWPPRFVVVANTEAADGGAAVVAGNERVLRARLSDAKYLLGPGPQADAGKPGRRSWPSACSTPSSARDLERTSNALKTLGRTRSPDLVGADPDLCRARRAGCARPT